MRHKRRLNSAKPHFYKNQFEKEAWQENTVVCGVDEVGRGCLAGPVVTAAVILPPHTDHSFLKDSKKMSSKEREAAYLWITKHCISAVGIINHRIVDSDNILQATHRAMKKAIILALLQAPQTPAAIVIDAVNLSLAHTSWHDIPIFHFIKGEDTSPSIAAASIVAKVTRDALLAQLHTLFPGYYLANHKGYGTQKHQTILLNRKPLIIHRNTFLKKIYAKKRSSNHEGQQRLC